MRTNRFCFPLCWQRWIIHVASCAVGDHKHISANSGIETSSSLASASALETARQEGFGVTSGRELPKAHGGSAVDKDRKRVSFETARAWLHTSLSICRRSVHSITLHKFQAYFHGAEAYSSNKIKSGDVLTAYGTSKVCRCKIYSSDAITEQSSSATSPVSTSEVNLS